METARVIRSIRSDPIATYVGAFRRYGDVFRIRGPGIRQYALYKHEHVEQVFVKNQDNYIKGPEFEVLAEAAGQGLVTSNGELWRRQRKLVQPLFAKRHLEPLAPHMVGAANALLADWDGRFGDGGRLDVAHEMTGLTLDVVGRALFSADLSGDIASTVGEAMTEALPEVLAMMVSPITWGGRALPGMDMKRAMRLRPRSYRRLRTQVNRIDALIEPMIARRAASGDERPADLLQLLLDARDEQTGEPMGLGQVRDEVATFLLAGHETTTNALAWMWWLLGRHPDVEERLLAEVETVLGERDPEFADADRLVWTRACVQEAMRLYPPLPFVARHSVEEDEIGGVTIEPESMIAVIVYMTHRDPDVWPQPEKFDPERFLPEQARERPRHAYVPFSAGRRVCVGNTFALTEATLLTAMIARRWDLDVEPGHIPVPEALNTLRPRGGLPMRIRPR
jgi:cytochrome P450